MTDTQIARALEEVRMRENQLSGHQKGPANRLVSIARWGVLTYCHRGGFFRPTGSSESPPFGGGDRGAWHAWLSANRHGPTMDRLTAGAGPRRRGPVAASGAEGGRAPRI